MIYNSESSVVVKVIELTGKMLLYRLKGHNYVNMSKHGIGSPFFDGTLDNIEINDPYRVVVLAEEVNMGFILGKN